jgi:hypothetical protein
MGQDAVLQAFSALCTSNVTELLYFVTALIVKGKKVKLSL